ncbi:MAG: hypothetical protein AAB368_02700, partial [bacterium]
MSLPLWTIRSVAVAVGLAGWYGTQALIGRRKAPPGRIGDGVHDLTAGANAWLNRHPRAANRLLVASSAGIDALGVFLLASAILGESFRPFVGLLIIYGLRQVCQALCALPAPRGMIWRNPGVPSLLVTYGVANDLFFSGHTAIAVYGAVELARWGAPWAAVGIGVAVAEAAAVLVLRAHYTLDVFAAVMTSLWASRLAEAAAPWCDALLAR